MILADTHVVLWLRLRDPRLGAAARRSVEQALLQGDAAVSAISFWEIGMRIQKEQIEFEEDLGAWRRALLNEGLVEIPVNGAIAGRAGLLPDLHGDPADRLIVATALEGHQLVTADQRILDWPGRLNRLDARE